MKIILFLLLCASTMGIAQTNTISGTVVRTDNEQPIANASVFISNTSKATQCAVDGSFVLNDVPVGKYDLIVSCVGYQTLTYTYTPSALPLRLKVKLDVKVNNLGAVTVIPFAKDGWEKWGKTFLDAYLGTTANSAYCKILNKDAIKFRFHKKENRLEVIATDIVIIENKKLGYRVKHQLELFECDFNVKSIINLGYPFFEEIEPRGKRKQRKYAEAREQAYKGSLLHLFRSFYNNQLATEGFVVRDLKEVENEIKKNYKETLKKKMQGDTSVKTTGTGSSILMQNNKATLGTKQVVTYTVSDIDRNIMAQPDYYEVIDTKAYTANDLLKMDSIDTDLKVMTFPNKLYVEYKNEKQSDLYYSTQFLKQRYVYQTTRLFFVDAKRSITIDANGNYYDALSIFLDGYMGWEKMGEMLPLDYRVGE
jgi:hypothetical protein